MADNASIFSILAKRMDWLGQRQRVLAENVANADTPEYQPRDMKADSFRRYLERLRVGSAAPAATHASHIRTSQQHQRDAGVEEATDQYETSPSGNAVIIEEQLVKIAETQMHYQTMTNLYKKHVDLFKHALRGPN